MWKKKNLKKEKISKNKKLISGPSNPYMHMSGILFKLCLLHTEYHWAALHTAKS